MARTRAAALDGAARCIEERGTRRATMSDIAHLGGIAKATLYNHFRTKDDVFAALVEDRIAQLGEECARVAESDLAAALALAASRAADHPAVRRVGAEEPAVLASLLVPSDAGGWAVARSAARKVLAAGGRHVSDGSVELLLRWVASHLVAPADEEARTEGAAALAAGLPSAHPPGS